MNTMHLRTSAFLIAVNSLIAAAPGSQAIDFEKSYRDVKAEIERAVGVTLDTQLRIVDDMPRDGQHYYGCSAPYAAYDVVKKNVIVSASKCRTMLFRQALNSKHAEALLRRTIAHELLHAYQSQHHMVDKIERLGPIWKRFLYEGHAIVYANILAGGDQSLQSTSVDIGSITCEWSLQRRHDLMMHHLLYSLAPDFARKHILSIDQLAQVDTSRLAYAYLFANIIPREHSNVPPSDFMRITGQDLAKVIQLDYLDCMALLAPQHLKSPRLASEFRQAAIGVISNTSSHREPLEIVVVELSTDETVEHLWTMASAFWKQREVDVAKVEHIVDDRMLHHTRFLSIEDQFGALSFRSRYLCLVQGSDLSTVTQQMIRIRSMMQEKDDAHLQE